MLQKWVRFWVQKNDLKMTTFWALFGPPFWTGFFGFFQFLQKIEKTVKKGCQKHEKQCFWPWFTFFSVFSRPVKKGSGKSKKWVGLWFLRLLHRYPANEGPLKRCQKMAFFWFYYFLTFFKTVKKWWKICSYWFSVKLITKMCDFDLA